MITSNKVRHVQLSPPSGAAVLWGITVAIWFTLFAKLGYKQTEKMPVFCCLPMFKNKKENC